MRRQPINYIVDNERVATVVNKHPQRLIGFAGSDPHKGKVSVKVLDYAVKELGLAGV